MPGKSNLKPVRSVDEAREKGAKGGKASGEARRKRKALKDNMNLLLDLPVSDRRKWNAVSRMYVEPDDIDNAMLLTVALFKAAANGNVKAYQEIRDLVGEGGGRTDDDVLRKLDDVLGGIDDAAAK